jgi:hypothetical protein
MSGDRTDRAKPGAASDQATGSARGHANAHEPIPDAYVLERVRDALASDARVGELGLDVELAGDVLVVRGAVSTAARKASVEPVAREARAGLGVSHEVQDRTEVPPATGAEEEVLA